ncbi:nucleoside phosphatase family-domain-containing protein [Mycena floridula]|nr:nucleoside phosphatase family-domain-containing protein [Mycena floridula]
MPPPTAVDAWFTGRHFGVVIDAGSSGSRVQIYSWQNPARGIGKNSPEALLLPKVEKGTKNGAEWVHKVEPGISTFSDNIKGIAEYLRPLLAHADQHIPPSLHPNTPLFLLATAGMRLLTPEQQAEVLLETCYFLRNHSHFKIETASAAGPCGSSVRIITGEEEGLFGWIAVNYLMDGFKDERTTYGFLDMGGASTQIAFEPSKPPSGNNTLMDVRLRLLGGDEIRHSVFVTTWLGYGTNQARERYVGQTVQEFEETRVQGSSDVVPDPCLPKNLELTELPVHLGPSTEHASDSHHLLGTGSFEQCVQKTSSLLNKDAPCPDSPCLMNGIHVPEIDFSVSRFIGVSEYWFSSEHVFGLGGPYDFVQYERAASKFCSRTWEDIVKEHEKSREKHTLGGDGEVEEDGKIVKVGQWGNKIELSRLEMQCFKAAWIVNVLHEGIGMPRIVDPDGNPTTEGDKVAETAEKKGLGRPTFQSIDSIDDIAISWTLGKMVLEASKEVPLAKTDRPLVDPIDEILDIPNFPIQPIRPPFMDVIEDQITPHLPEALTRASLGFSPVFLLFWIILFLFILLFVPVGRRIRGFCLRALRSLRHPKRDAGVYYELEEGPLSRPPSPPSLASKVLEPVRRALRNGIAPSRPSTITQAIITGNGNGNSNGNLRPGLPQRFSPRSYSFNSTASNSTATSTSRPASPSFLDDPSTLLGPRSRNTSQISLSNMVTRQTVVVNRVTSGPFRGE